MTPFDNIECDLHRVVSCALRISGCEKCCCHFWVYLLIPDTETPWDAWIPMILLLICCAGLGLNRNLRNSFLEDIVIF